MKPQIVVYGHGPLGRVLERNLDLDLELAPSSLIHLKRCLINILKGKIIYHIKRECLLRMGWAKLSCSLKETRFT